MHRAHPPRADTRAQRLVDPWELNALAMFTLATFIADIATPKTSLETANEVLAVTLMIILCGGCYSQTRRRRSTIWTPLFWFRIAVAVYYGFGTIVPYIVNTQTNLFIRSLYDFTDAEALKLLRIYAICTFWTLLAASIAITPKRTHPTRLATWTPRGHLMIATAFVIIGGAIRYGIQIPHIIGVSAFALPAGLATIGKSYIAGLFLLLLYGLRYDFKIFILAAALAILDLFVSTLMFIKGEVLLTLIFTYLAFISHKPSAIRTIVGATTVSVVFLQLQPLVHYGRHQIAILSGKVSNEKLEVKKQATLAQRMNILNNYLDPWSNPSAFGEPKNSILRLTYVNAGTMVVSWHDKKWAGDTYRNAFAALIPRVIWPEKPMVGNLGAELYRKARGTDGASISAGLFAESYYNLGWWGFIMFLPVGVMFRQISLFAMSSVEAERWLRLPVILFGVQMATRVDGHYVMDICGGFAIFSVLLLFILALEHFVAGGRYSVRHRSGAPAWAPIPPRWQ